MEQRLEQQMALLGVAFPDIAGLDANSDFVPVMDILLNELKNKGFPIEILAEYGTKGDHVVELNGPIIFQTVDGEPITKVLTLVKKSGNLCAKWSE